MNTELWIFLPAFILVVMAAIGTLGIIPNMHGERWGTPVNTMRVALLFLILCSFAALLRGLIWVNFQLR